MRYISISVRLVIAPYHYVDNNRVSSIVNWKRLLYDECVWWKKYIKNFFFLLSFFVWPWPDPTCVSWQGPSARTRTEWPFETSPSMASCICPQWALSAPQTLCVTTSPGSDFTLTKDGLKFMKYSHRLLAAFGEMSFSSHIIPGLDTQVYWWGMVSHIAWPTAKCKHHTVL